MMGISIGRSSVAPNTNIKTKQATEIARQGQIGNRRVSTGSGTAGPIREQLDNATVATPISTRNVGLVPDDPTRLPISWFTEHLPSATAGLDSTRRNFDAVMAKDNARDVVHFAQEIDKDILRASELLEKSEDKPLNEKEQREVKILLGAGKYNLEQTQRWASMERSERTGHPEGQEFFTKLQERLADRHMDLADLMCLYNLDQTSPEHAVSRADRIDHSLVITDAALDVTRGLTVSGLSEDAKEEMIEVLKGHRDGIDFKKGTIIGKTGLLSKEVWDTSFSLVKDKETGDSIASLHTYFDAKKFPLDHPKLTQEQMLQEFVSHQLKRAGVTEENMPDLQFQFKEAINRVRNERPWVPIEKQLNYTVAGEEHTVHSKITPVKTMVGTDHFATDLPANGICSGDRMQYTHVPNLARTELTDASGKTLFSALRHGVLDAYDISASTLRKLPNHKLFTTVKDLLVPATAKKTASEKLDPYVEIADGRASQATSTGKADGANANPTVLTYGEGDYATIQRATPREVSPDLPSDVPPPYSSDVATPGETPGNLRPVSDTDRDLRVNLIVDEIRTNPAQASKHASDMRTAASAKMAEELAVTALVGDPDKLQAALKGETVNIALSSISLLPSDRTANRHKMLDHQTAALKQLDSKNLSLQVRDEAGELRTVKVSCKVRDFHFDVHTGAVGRARHMPSQVHGWDKLMSWSYKMEHHNQPLRELLGDPKSEVLGGDVQDKLHALDREQLKLSDRLVGMKRSLQNNPWVAERLNPQISECERKITATTRSITTLKEAATATKQIWREGNDNKGDGDPYKLVSRLNMVISEMGETLTFNCKSGNDRSGQLDTELKYFTALNAAGVPLLDTGAPVTPELRQMRSDFTLNSGNLEMQRMNIGLPNFKKDSTEALDPANASVGNIYDQITYFDEVSNTCPEQCAIFAAKYYNLECKFDAYKHDGQINIFPPLSKYAPAPAPDADIPGMFIDGKTEVPCFNYLQKLDKSAIYLMRTGENEASGHNQVLYSKDNEWFVHDTEKRQYKLTSDGSLTPHGIQRLVKKNATWGQEKGQSSIATVQITKDGASTLIGYIKEARNLGTDRADGELLAILNIYKQQ